MPSLPAFPARSGSERVASVRSHAVAGPHRAARVRFAFQAGGPIRGQTAVDALGRAYFAALDGQLYALATDGSERFRRDLGAASYGGVTLTRSGQLAVGTADGRLELWTADGELVRRVDVGEPVETPVVEGAGGTLYLGAGHQVYAYGPDLARRTTLSAKGLTIATPAVDAQGRVFMASQDHHLRAFHADGRPWFAVDLGRDLDGSPVVADDAVFVAGDDGLVAAFALADGRRRFGVQVDGHVRAPLAYAAGVVWVQTMGPRPALLALSARDGQTLGGHRFPFVDAADQGSRSGPVIDAAGWVFVGGPDDAIYGFDTQGRLGFRLPTQGRVHATPTLSPDGTLYTGCDDGRLYAISEVRSSLVP